MKNFTLGQKIGLGFASLIIISAILGLVAMFSMRSAESSARVMSTQYVAEADIATSMESDIWSAQLAVRSYGFTSEEAYLKEARRSLVEVHRHVDLAQQLAAAHPELVKLREHLDSLLPLLKRYEQAVDETAAKNGEIVAGRDRLNKAAGDFIANIDKLIAAQTERFDKEIGAFTEVEKLRERREKLTLINEVRGEGNAARIAVFKSQALRDPKIIAEGLAGFESMDKRFSRLFEMLKVQADIEELTRVQEDANSYRNAMKAIMNDYIALAAIGVQRAEVGTKLIDLADETATAGMKRAVSAADESSSKLATSSLLVLCGLLTALAVGIGMAFLIIRDTTKVLTRVATSLRDASTQVSSASGQVSSSSQSLAEGASEQAASLEETSSSLEEINSMAKRSAENAQTANTIAGETRTVADQGTQQMDEMLAAMNAIKASSDNISKVIKTIDEIAFQTNILALNAAVEAARAGEAGAGFAVVADEVRSLAQRAAQAAKETAGMIDESINRSGAGVGISSRVAATLKEIADKARRVNELVGEIASASTEQSNGVQQVNAAVSQMDKVTQSNAANAEETAAASEELNAQALALSDSVDELMALVGGRVDQASPAASGKPASGKASSFKMARPEGRKSKLATGTGAARGQTMLASAGGPRDGRADDFFKSS